MEFEGVISWYGCSLGKLVQYMILNLQFLVKARETSSSL